MRPWIFACGLFVSTAAHADADGDGYATEEDCDDTNSEINPTAPELCDGLDNNCDGAIDEGVTLTFWADIDGDGYGDPNNALELCEQQEGYVINSQDCDDGEATTNPLAEEICDGIDNNCNNVTDEGCDEESSNEPSGEPSGEPSSEPGPSEGVGTDDDENRYAYPANSGRPEGLDASSQGCGGGKSALALMPLLLIGRRRRHQ